MITHGVSAGDVVAIMLPNQASYIVALFAAWRLGATVTPISPTSMPAEAAYQITDADAKILIADTPLEIDVPVVAVSTEELASGAAAAVVEPADHGPGDAEQNSDQEPWEAGSLARALAGAAAFGDKLAVRAEDLQAVPSYPFSASRFGRHSSLAFVLVQAAAISAPSGREMAHRHKDALATAWR